MKCQHKSCGDHATEEDAARAYNIEAERIGRVDFNVIPPADGDDGDDPATCALLSLAAPARMHAGAGTKRAGTSTTPARPQRKKMRVDHGNGTCAFCAAAKRKCGSPTAPATCMRGGGGDKRAAAAATAKAAGGG